jgi:hypothetical protein
LRPVDAVEFEDGDLYSVCIECADNVDDSAPPFVVAMQERIANAEIQIKTLGSACALLGSAVDGNLQLINVLMQALQEIKK